MVARIFGKLSAVLLFFSVSLYDGDSLTSDNTLFLTWTFSFVLSLFFPLFRGEGRSPVIRDLVLLFPALIATSPLARFSPRFLLFSRIFTLFCLSSPYDHRVSPGYYHRALESTVIVSIGLCSSFLSCRCPYPFDFLTASGIDGESNFSSLNIPSSSDFDFFFSDGLL